VIRDWVLLVARVSALGRCSATPGDDDERFGLINRRIPFLAGRNVRSDIRGALGSLLVRESVSRTELAKVDARDVSAIPMYVTVDIAKSGGRIAVLRSSTSIHPEEKL